MFGVDIPEPIKPKSENPMSSAMIRTIFGLFLSCFVGMQLASDKVIRSNPEILVNLYVLFSANLTHTTALSRISSVIQCFQSNNFFTVPKFPSLDEDIMK